MSREQEYFPPSGSKYKWGSKALNYSPWICDLGAQMDPDIHYLIYPLDVRLYVDLVDGKFKWVAICVDWHGARSEKTGLAESGSSAIKEAEAFGEEFYNSQMLPWIRTALQAGWRPPARK